MNQHNDDSGDTGRPTDEIPLTKGGETALRANREHPSAGFVVDLSQLSELDVADLAILLTAQQLAQEEDRVVWLAGLSLPIWQALQRMGLGRFFLPFPSSGTGVM